MFTPCFDLGLPLLRFGSGLNKPGFEFEPQRLYFTSGINDEADGLFGFIRPATASYLWRQ